MADSINNRSKNSGAYFVQLEYPVLCLCFNGYQSMMQFMPSVPIILMSICTASGCTVILFFSTITVHKFIDEYLQYLFANWRSRFARFHIHFEYLNDFDWHDRTPYLYDFDQTNKLIAPPYDRLETSSNLSQRRPISLAVSYFIAIWDSRSLIRYTRDPLFARCCWWYEAIRLDSALAKQETPS